MNKIDKLLLEARSRVSVVGWPYMSDLEFIEALGVNPDNYKKILPSGEVVYNMQRAGEDSVKFLNWDEEEGECGVDESTNEDEAEEE